jgi:ureidoacrylate peracid hydrolase
MPQPSWDIDVSSSALVIVDMQNAFCTDEGFMTKLGLDVSQCIRAVEPTRRILQQFRDWQAPVVFTRYWLRPDYTDAGLFENLFPGSIDAQAMVAGTWDAQIIDPLAPNDGEFVVDKQRYSAFYNTNLEIILRSLGVDTLVVAGVTTNICVDSTVRDALARDFKNVVLEDCTGAVDELMQKGALHTFRYGFADVMTSEDFLAKASVPA